MIAEELKSLLKDVPDDLEIILMDAMSFQNTIKRVVIGKWDEADAQELLIFVPFGAHIPDGAVLFRDLEDEAE